MVQRIFVTIGSRKRKDRLLMEMPGDMPIREWIGDLAQVVGWKELSEVPSDGFRLETEEGERLNPDDTLLNVGVNSSDLLYLAAQESPAIPQAEGNASAAPLECAGATAADGISLQDIRRMARLMGPQGLVILIGNPPLTIGRAGKGSKPDIDLSEWDAKVIASRKHTLLEKIGDGFSLRPEKTTNGTFINGVEAPAGDSRKLADGDRIQFGFGGLELIFRYPECRR